MNFNEQFRMEAIFSYISEHSPSIGLIIIVAVAVYYVTMYHVSIQNTRKKVDGLPCDAHLEKIVENGNKIDALDAKVVSIKNTTDRLCGIVDDIREALIFKGIIDPASALKKFSPYQLTEIGTKMLEVSGGKRCIDQNLDLFMSELRNRSPLTPYDVEKISLDVLLQYKNTPTFNGIKKFLYNMPETVEGVGKATSISIFTVAQVMAIYLRDFYLEAHPELVSDMEALEA